MEFWKRFSGFVWNETFWLPPNVTWIDMKTMPDKQYPEFYALFYPIPLALVIFFVRLLVEKIIFEPVGNWLRIPGRRRKPMPKHAALEAAFNESKNLLHHDIMGLAKRCDMTERQVERWFRRRENESKVQVTQLDKFKETGWRFSFYLGIFTYGIWALWDKPWFWDSSYFWMGYPFQEVNSDIWWYYMVELGFYWSLLISQFFDVKRKDFWEMFFHHIITISLMCFSWTDNTIRVGTMVLVIHDAVDFWLEGAKLAKYARKAKLSSVLFVLFALVWVLTRLFAYPYRVLRFTLPCPMGERCFPAFHLYNCLLCSLQVLHVFWTFTIMRVIYRALNTGKTEDVRSDTEDSGEADNHVDDGVQYGHRKRLSDVVGSGDKAVFLNGTGNGFHVGERNGDIHGK
ncbi:ceramide synthase 6-like [Paramacrobiotus metropolitanus]|uniref:ceramide synthase 6-like n=1 Tax=Paramacrobiotus metropolitanus TaxID=2943436 RepID=UPI002445C146|nr:ceramide synthase 6-like [Paramacrobiotus metropolitanus]XP_055357926.1 ceramide synthase 6-like [Paramacrobiotus metropolitanus]XP_055357927.1 ceramide synthase 6-like [Paramacrobiotus metropolitanus]XP_055357929.1 ceramide synthase 6-like [Paramacrobiotus metropolitanus]XP_055357930.1 ceramide synthase 6-like [Paramacrobiotus metropolitanus]